MEKMIWMRILRAYPRGGVLEPVGRDVQVPESAVASMVEANPPYGRKLSADERKELEPPVLLVDAAGATSGAVEPVPPASQPTAEYHSTDGTVQVPAIAAPVPLTLEDDMPPDFPGRAALDAAGIATLGDVPRTSAELEAMDGIGAATAKKILEYPGLPPLTT